MTTKQKVLDYIKEHPEASPKDVAAAVGTTIQYVNTIKYLQNKPRKAKRKLGRPRKNVSPFDGAVLKREDPELRDLRIAVSQHAHVVDRLKKEISELTVIIAYLEHRCFKAEGPRGPAI